MLSIIEKVLAAVSPGMRQLFARRRHHRVVRTLLARIEAMAAHEREQSPRLGVETGVRISLIAPTYNTPIPYLEELIRSFEAQGVPEAELVLSDDGSPDPATRAYLAALDRPQVRVLLNPVNGGIAAASQAGLAAAAGTWVTFIDHDDALFPHALDRILRALDANPHCQFLYTDEVVTDSRMQAEDIFLKPAFDEVLLSGVNYVNHFSCYRRERLMALGGFRLGFDGSQDYDLLLRYTKGLRPGEALHLPYPAYRWRRDGRSYSATFMDKATAKARKALSERFATADGPVDVSPALLTDLHRVRFDRPGRAWPKVTAIIPSRDSPGLIRTVLEGLLAKTDYPDLHAIVIDNGTTNAETLAIYEDFGRRFPNLRVSIQPEPFNFARAINRGAGMTADGHLLLLNNDIEFLDSGWLKEMVSCLDYGDVGVVGAKLLYPDRTFQHAGVIAGFGGLAGHWYLNLPEDYPGPMGRLAVRQALSVVTGACFLVSRACWTATGPMDEARFAIAYNDVDFCLRARELGFRVIWTPFAAMLHHESASRGSDETPQNIERFRREQDNLRERHRTDRMSDPAISPWLTTDRSVPEMKLLDFLPPAR